MNTALLNPPPLPVPSRGLQGRHQTLPGPLLFNAQYLIRLQFPLGYNFMRILRYYGTKSNRTPALQLPAFQNLMNDMRTVPVLGTNFNVYAPLLLVVLCAFTYYKVRTAACCSCLSPADTHRLLFVVNGEGRGVD